jgi:hypothetical protein
LKEIRAVARFFPLADVWDALGQLIRVLFVASLVIGSVLGVGVGIAAVTILKTRRRATGEKPRHLSGDWLRNPITFLQDLIIGTFACGAIGGLTAGLRYGFYSTSVRDYSFWGAISGLVLSTSLQFARHTRAYGHLRRLEIALAGLCAGLLVGFVLTALLGGGMLASAICIPFGAAMGLCAGLASLAHRGATKSS